VKFEDFQVGQEWVSAPHVVDRDDMLRFSRQFDPQPIHVDGDAGKAGPFGDIIGSGFMTMALAWRLWLDLGVQGDDGLAGLGIEGLRWSRPLLAGSTVTAHVSIAEHRVTRQGHGLITFEMRLRDQDDAEVVRFLTTGLHARREAPGA
jgi:acyl dehydratase